MYRCIMVPLDGSAFGEHVLPLALALARRAGATLHLVHVHPPAPAVYLEGAGFLDGSLDEEVKRQQQDYLNAVAERLTRDAPVPVTTALLEGGVAHTLAEHAAGAGVGLVVMA